MDLFISFVKCRLIAYPVVNYACQPPPEKEFTRRTPVRQERPGSPLHLLVNLMPNFLRAVIKVQTEKKYICLMNEMQTLPAFIQSLLNPVKILQCPTKRLELGMETQKVLFQLSCGTFRIVITLPAGTSGPMPEHISLMIFKILIRRPVRIRKQRNQP